MKIFQDWLVLSVDPFTMWGEAFEVCRNLHKNVFPDGQFEQPVKSLENIDLYLEQHLVIPRITVLAYEETSQI